VISLNDLELPILARHKNDIKEKTGAKVIVPSEEVIDICFDKIKTVEFAKNLNIQTPLTFLSAESFKSANAAGDIEFPVVVKPRWGSASIGLEFPEEMREFELSFEMINIKLDRTILSEVSSADRDSAIMIQQKIAGREYGLDIVNDLEGNHVGVIVKEKLSMRSGETDKAVTVNNSEISAIGKLIGENLGHVGNLDCDIMEENGQYYLIEMNPRFGGGYPFSHEAGANVPKAILSWLEGAPSSDKFLEVSFHSAFSKCDRLVGIRPE
jgi:carbamoyl-phosphate synthase large subunit